MWTQRQDVIGMFILVLALSVTVTPVEAGSLLYSFGPDSNGVARDFSSITQAGVAASQFLLGDGITASFNGGLAYRPTDSRFYAIANDSSGTSSFASFSIAGGGTLTPISTLGQGFLGGLAFDSADGNFYALANDFNGQSSLYSITASGASSLVSSLELMLSATGLAYNANDGLLYAFSSDGNGVPRLLYSIDIQNSSVAFVSSFGDGSAAFNGGLAFDPAANLFYAISNDASGNSTLDTFTSAGSGSLAPVAAFGVGYVNAGLALVTTEQPIPEPPTLLLFLSGLLLTFKAVRNKKRPSVSYINLMTKR